MTGGKKIYIEFIENLFKCRWRHYSHRVRVRVRVTRILPV